MQARRATTLALCRSVSRSLSTLTTGATVEAGNMSVREAQGHMSLVSRLPKVALYLYPLYLCLAIAYPEQPCRLDGVVFYLSI